MRIGNSCVLVVAAMVLCRPMATAQEPGSSRNGFHFEAISEHSLKLSENGQPVLVYNHGQITSQQMPRAVARSCYVHPIYGLDGEILTDDFPKDHPYHRGMYWAWPHIKLGDKEYELWSLNGELQPRFIRWLAKDAGADAAKLAAENGWFVSDKQLVREQVTLDVHPTGADSRAIDVTLVWTPLEQPLTLWGAAGKSYGGFNFRFGPRTKTVITVPEKAELPEGVTAPEGRTDGDLVVTRLPWADFSGDFAGAKGMSGAAIFVHPAHRDYPPTWMTRHYGLVSVGWPGVQPQTFPSGEPITCRYSVWIHRSSPTAAEIDARYQEYRQQGK